MKRTASFVPSKRAVNVLFAVYAAAFLVGLIGAFVLPKEERLLRKIAIGMSYFFGLPIVLSLGLVLLRKIGVWNGK